MASSLALKRLVSQEMFSTSLRPLRAVAQPVSSRRFNTDAVRDYESDREYEVDRRPERRVFSPFPEVFDPLSTRSSLSQILNMMDQFMDTPAAVAAVRRNWNARETPEGLDLRMDMPGLGKEDVKVSVEQNTLIIKGEGKKEFEDDETSGRRYTSRIDLPEKLYKTSEIKAEMKNGVLKVFLPKIKEEERADVFHVNIE